MPENAAFDALATEQPGKAVRELRARIDRPRTGDELPRLRLELGRALVAQARFSESARELEALTAEPNLAPELRASALGILAGALALSGRPGDGVTVAEEALASPAADADTRVLARSAIRGVLFFEGRFDDAVRHARRTVRDARDAGPLARAEARLDMGGMLSHADRFDEAEEWLALEPDATEHQRHDARVIVAQMDLVRGRWSGVLAAVPAARGAVDADWSDHSNVFQPALRANALIHLDRAEQARRELGRPLGRGAPPISLVNWSLLAELEGDIAAAGSFAERAAALADDLASRPQLRIWALDLARLALLAGDTTAARRVQGVMEALAAKSSVRSVGAGALAVRGMVEGDRDLLGTAQGIFSAGPRRVATAQTAEALAELQRLRGDRPAAVEALRRSLNAWESTGAVYDARRVARRLLELGVRTRPVVARRSGPGRESLTPTETTVARLVAEGMTNADIARRLVVSRRTVETHVAHVLAKLEVRTRTGIARAAVEKRI